MDHSLASLKVCFCCLSTEGEALRLVKSPDHILDLLVGRELDLAELWLCYRCSHTVRKICHFRELCSRAYVVLQKYSAIKDSDVARNCIREEMETFCQGREPEPSMSNTLCMSIVLDRLESSISIDSFNRNGKSPKNYTENISRHHEIVSDSVKIKTEFYGDQFDTKAHPDIPCLTNLKFEDSCIFPELEEDNHETEEFSAELACKVKDTKRTRKKSKINKSNSAIHKKPSFRKLLIKKKTQRNSLPSNKQVSMNNEDSLRLIHTYEKPLIRKKISRSIAEEIDKVFANPLTFKEQMKEKEERSKEESYLHAAYKCDLCVLTFQSQLAMVNHSKKHGENVGPHVCPVCSLRFAKHNQFRIHSESHSIRFICHICDKRVYNKDLFKKHLIWHSDEFKCPKCGEAFTDKKTMKEHKVREHPTKKYECETCGKLISSKYLYRIHIQRHSGIPTHVCSICSKGFYSEPNLYLHMETHQEKTPHKHYCVECDRHFKSLISLNIHLMYSAAHRDVSILKFKCTQCPMAFYNSTLLSQHTTSKHGGVHKYVCDECGASYAIRCGLVRHIKSVHQGYQLPKKFPCTVCEKAFTTKALVANHMRVHTGERPFKCPQCSDTFKQKSALGTHIKLVHLKLKRNVKLKKKAND